MPLPYDGAEVPKRVLSIQIVHLCDAWMHFSAIILRKK